MQDNNFSLENNSNCCYLVYKIDNIEKIDKVEHNMITNNKIDGLLAINYSSIDDKYFYKYDITSKVSLERYITGCNDRDKIVKILVNTLKIFIEIKDFLILKEHIILDENYIFVDVSDGSLHFICLPIYDNNTYKSNLKTYINNVISKLSFEDFENKNLIYLLKDVINKEDLIDIKEVLNVLKNINHNKKITKQERHEEIDKFDKEEKKVEIECDILNNTQKRNIKKLNEDKIDFLVPGQEEKVKIKKDKNKNKNKSKIDLKNIFKVPKNDKKSVVKENNQVIKHEKNEDDRKNKNETYNHTVVIKSSNSSEQTSLLHALNSGLYPIMPYLIRKKNSEKINITSDLFRIGKEIDYVDYAIKDNNTISRAHADIIKINKDYYIQDNNSKNHTYVNDNMVSDGQAVKLEHNYEIKLSNELFIFKLY